MASRMRPFQRIMEPADRIAEVMFGLIMALTFTGSISISDAGRNDVRAMLIGALGCNIAWGLIDGIFYVMIGFADRGRDARALQAVRNADDPAHAKALLAQTLPDEVAGVLTEEQLERVRVTLKQAPPPIPPTPGVRDLLAGLAVASLVFGSTLPIALPFLLFQFDRSYTTLTGLRALGVPVLGSVSHLVFPDGQRRERIQLAAVCASVAGLLFVYGLLLAISANMYRLGIV